MQPGTPRRKSRGSFFAREGSGGGERERGYCFACEHSTFISLHTRNTLFSTMAAASG
jgi:hypothetical protein